MSAPAAAVEPTAVAKGHPKGLYFLFATEMWERFSYYGMRALLVLYLINYLRWQPSDSSTVYKWYTSLVYLTPLLGGYLADKYIGLRRSIVIGGVLMAIGHFLMAFEPLPALFSALAFLIMGNGFFKPNISTLVGKMYRADDPRRDGAFTIFYMGINLGAFFSPLVCGGLRDVFGSFHYGFAAAGVGMCIGLAVFLIGQKRIRSDVEAAGNTMDIAAKPKDGQQSEDAAERLPRAGGISGLVGTVLSPLMLVIAVAVPVWYGVQLARGEVRPLDLLMPVAFAMVAGWMGLTLRRVKGAGYDKSTVIFYLFAFSVFFWMAFEQAGNALNIWADVNTDLHVGSYEYPAEWFQSVNPLLIILLGPLFAFMWTSFDRKGIGIPTPAKMLIGLFFMALSFLAMVGGAAAENQAVTRIPLAGLPAATAAPGGAAKQVDVSHIHAGRLTYDEGTKELVARGVFAPFARAKGLALTVPPPYAESVEALEGAAQHASPERPVTVPLASVPAGFELPATAEEAKWDALASTLTVTAPLSASAKADLLGAGAPPEWRQALGELEKKSQAGRVGGFWLFVSYLLATLGELCLSPVGLSMVTKLAPARFASLFMGVWLLSSSVAQYVGGTLGELWGEIPPTDYFWIFVWTSLAGSVILALLVKPLTKLMHGVR